MTNRTNTNANTVNDALAEFISVDKHYRQGHVAAQFAIRNNPALRQVHLPTGLPSLDTILGGGIAPGLICLGGVSGLGKTTLAMQIASNLAEQNVKVIVFSLEMTSVMLTGKEVSRQTFLATPDRPHLAKTLNAIMDSNVASNMTDEEWSVVEAAAKKTEAAWRNISIVDTTAERQTATSIETYVMNYIAAYQVRPVVIVDYLQILGPAPGMTGTTDKQVVDANLNILRRMANRHKIPVIVVSSLNRGGYDKSIEFAAFKESGGIEYTCDTLLGIQLAGVGEQGFSPSEAKEKDVRKIEIVVLKQRFGPVGKKIACNYYAAFNHFEDTLGDTDTTTNQNTTFDY